LGGGGAHKGPCGGGENGEVGIRGRGFGKHVGGGGGGNGVFWGFVCFSPWAPHNVMSVFITKSFDQRCHRVGALEVEAPEVHANVTPFLTKGLRPITLASGRIERCPPPPKSQGRGRGGNRGEKKNNGGGGGGRLLRDGWGP